MSTSTVSRPDTSPGGKPGMSPLSMLVWGAVAAVGALCWVVLALS